MRASGTAAGRCARALCRWLPWMLAAALGGASADERAGPSKPDDFAYGIAMRGDGEHAVLELAVPVAAYQHATRADLGDLRVFSAAGQVMPHALTAVEPDASSARRQEVLAFALDLPAAVGAAPLSLLLERDADGVIRGVRSAAPAQGATRRAFIVALAPDQRPVTGLQLNWRAPAASFVHSVALEASDDLRTWRPVREDWLIAHLRRDGRVIRHDDIELPPTDAAYLRVRLLDAGPAPDVRSAVVDVGTPRPAPQLVWLDLPVRADAQTPGRWLFDVPVALRMRALHVRAPVPDSYARPRLLRRADPARPWAGGATFAVYDLADPAGRLRNAPLPVSGDAVSHWAIELPDPEAFDAQAPGVRVGWYPHTLVFITRGAGPYTLAFGSADAAPVVRDGRELLSELGIDAELGAAGFGLPAAELEATVHTLGGPAALSARPRPPDARRIVLWAVLVGGVLLLLWMAWRLLREAPASPP